MSVYAATEQTTPETAYNSAIIMGGYNGSTTYYQDTDRFIFASQAISVKTSMTTAARALMPGITIGGVHYIAGGYTGSAASNLTDAYTLSTDTWAPKTNMTAAKHTHFGYTDGTDFYMAGGSNLTTHYKYSVAGNSWSTMTAVPSRRDRAAGAKLGASGYSFGGYDGSNALATVSRYIFSVNAWTTQDDMAAAAYSAAAAALGEAILVTGGYSGSAALDTCDEFIALAWTAGGKGAMTQTRYQHGMVSAGTDSYVIAGRAPTASSSVEKFDGAVWVSWGSIGSPARTGVAATGGA